MGRRAKVTEVCRNMSDPDLEEKYYAMIRGGGVMIMRIGNPLERGKGGKGRTAVPVTAGSTALPVKKILPEPEDLVTTSTGTRCFHEGLPGAVQSLPDSVSGHRAPASRGSVPPRSSPGWVTPPSSLDCAAFRAFSGRTCPTPFTPLLGTQPSALLSTERCPAPLVEWNTPAPLANWYPSAPLLAGQTPEPLVDGQVPAPLVERQHPAPPVEWQHPAPLVERQHPAPPVEWQHPAPLVEWQHPAPLVEWQHPPPLVEAQVPAPLVAAPAGQPARTSTDHSAPFGWAAPSGYCGTDPLSAFHYSSNVKH